MKIRAIIVCDNDEIYTKDKKSHYKRRAGLYRLYRKNRYSIMPDTEIGKGKKRKPPKNPLGGAKH